MILPDATSHELQLLLDHLDNARAASELQPSEYTAFWRAKYWLIEHIVIAERLEHEKPIDLRKFTRAA